MFKSSTKREIRQFHVVVEQRRQGNVQKSVMHVQSFCFVNLNSSVFLPLSWPLPSSLLKLPSIKSQMTSKFGKTEEVAQGPQAAVSLVFLPHFDVLCDLLLNRPTVTWNLFVLYNDQKRRNADTHTCLVPLDCLRTCANFGGRGVARGGGGVLGCP